MYKYKLPRPTTLILNTSYVGERLEEKINRILNNREPITDGAPRIYTERKDGVIPAYNIRADRWEIAVDAMDKVQKANVAKREDKAKTLGAEADKNMKTEQKGESGGQSIPGTSGTETSK